jgi:hypothetical protein
VRPQRLQLRPRSHIYQGKLYEPEIFGQGTWLEPEVFCYPNGTMQKRRALCEDGKLRIFRCGMPNTVHSIPIKVQGGVRGLLFLREGILRFVEIQPGSVPAIIMIPARWPKAEPNDPSLT